MPETGPLPGQTPQQPDNSQPLNSYTSPMPPVFAIRDKPFFKPPISSRLTWLENDLTRPSLGSPEQLRAALVDRVAVLEPNNAILDRCLQPGEIGQQGVADLDAEMTRLAEELQHPQGDQQQVSQMQARLDDLQDVKRIVGMPTETQSQQLDREAARIYRSTVLHDAQIGLQALPSEESPEEK